MPRTYEEMRNAVYPAQERDNALQALLAQLNVTLTKAEKISLVERFINEEETILANCPLKGPRSDALNTAKVKLRALTPSPSGIPPFALASHPLWQDEPEANADPVVDQTGYITP